MTSRDELDGLLKSLAAGTFCNSGKDRFRKAVLPDPTTKVDVVEVTVRLEFEPTGDSPVHWSAGSGWNDHTVLPALKKAVASTVGLAHNGSRGGMGRKVRKATVLSDGKIVQAGVPASK